MKKAFLSILLLLLSVTGLTAQTVIKGTILEKDTGNALPGVNVYLSGTSIGAATNETGYYTFRTDLSGRFNLVVSFLGFKSINKQIILAESDTLNFDFDMEENPLQLGEVEITEKRDTEWEQRYSSFRRFFIGTDEYADQTEIENPEVIDFNDASGAELEVVFNAPLRLKNYATGYEISLELNRALFNPVSNTGFWEVYPLYTEMEIDNSSLQDIWDTNRENAFLGSSRHFFMSLNQNRLRSNNFVVLPTNSAIAKITDLQMIQQTFPGNWQRIVSEYNVFQVINVNFAVAHNPTLDRLGNVEDMNDLSSFDVRNRANLIVVDDYGNIFNSAQVIFLGPWSEDRFAKSLPMDYIVTE